MENDNLKSKNSSKKSFLLIVIIVSFVFLMSVMSLFKLGGVGDGDSINTPLRIVNRNIVLLSFAVFSLTIYLWRKE